MMRALIALIFVVFSGPVGLHAQQVVKIEASDGRPGNGFGFSVAISGDVAIIGTRWGQAAYIYERREGRWEEQVKLAPLDPEEEERFGRSVSVSGDHAVVGAPLSAGQPTTGAFYIFERERPDTSPVSNKTLYDPKLFWRPGKLPSV